MASKKVLATGSSGRIGRAVVKELQTRGHSVRGFDLVATPGLGDMVVGSLTDRSTVDRAMANVEAVVHLAATPDDADFLSEIVPNNIIGVHHIFESAKDAGVKRLVVASTGQVVWWQRETGPLPVRTDTQVTPRYWYACGKVFLEAAGRSFAEKFGLEVVAVRLGWCPRTKEQVEEIASDPNFQAVYLSPNDAGRFFACAVEATLPTKYMVTYATSQAKTLIYDMETADKILGYTPQETWPQGIEIVLGKAPGNAS